jgi:pimeloyl-ACP methyl ester carboxylesterase
MTVEPQELDVTVRSHRLHGQRFGAPTSPLVIGLHGLTLNMKAFDYLGERLARTHQLVAIDLRGRGSSPPTGAGTYGWENHALDAFAVADELGFERFSIVGQSMGGAVAMKAAELDPDRLASVVLVDIAGRVDRGAGELIGSVMASVHDEHESVEAYVDAIRAQGLVAEWNEYWDRCYRYGIEHDDGRVRMRVDPVALAEDRAYGAAHGGLYVYERWRHLSMPTLLLRATEELRPGTGHVVPADDCAAFVRDVPHGSIVEVDANHLTINVHPKAVEAVQTFLPSD